MGRADKLIRSKRKIKESAYRPMAANEGLMNIVDLIDHAHQQAQATLVEYKGDKTEDWPLLCKALSKLIPKIQELRDEAHRTTDESFNDAHNNDKKKNAADQAAMLASIKPPAAHPFNSLVVSYGYKVDPKHTMTYGSGGREIPAYNYKNSNGSSVLLGVDKGQDFAIVTSKNLPTKTAEAEDKHHLEKLLQTAAG